MRKKLVAKLFELSQGFYVRYFKQKKQAWGYTRASLLDFPKGTLGHEMGLFLESNGFEVIDKVERHDAYHVLLGFNTRAQDEVALQYLCFGNGKRSKYLFAVIALGSLILPEYIAYYYNCYKMGKQLNCFHSFDYKLLLNQPLDQLRAAICTSTQEHQIKQLCYDH
ncbi:MAG: Coq4 family protein [Gilvibacter sp.]